jgi:heme-degrading monooxygenase HmoA
VTLLTYLPLRSARRLPAFLRFTRKIQRQLAGAPGLVGYTLRAKPLRRQFWTLSAWESAEALEAFVVAAPHRDVMAALASDLGDGRFFRRGTARGSELPLRFDER